MNAQRAPLVTDTGLYDVRLIERLRLQRYSDRLAEQQAEHKDAQRAGDALARKQVHGLAIQASVRHRPIPKHRAMVRLDDLPKAATRARAASDSPR